MSLGPTCNLQAAVNSVPEQLVNDIREEFAHIKSTALVPSSSGLLRSPSSGDMVDSKEMTVLLEQMGLLQGQLGTVLQVCGVSVVHHVKHAVDSLRCTSSRSAGAGSNP